MNTPISPRHLRGRSAGGRTPYLEEDRLDDSLQNMDSDHPHLDLPEGSLNHRVAGAGEMLPRREDFSAGATTAMEHARATEENARMDSSRNIIHLRPALDRLGNDWELLQDMARFFLEDAPMLVEKTDAAITSGNAAEVEWAAHSLKGLASHFDASSLQTAAQQVETAGRAKNLGGLKDSAAELKVLVDKVCTELEANVIQCDHAPEDCQRS